jgi:predicted transcriptional regulator of viral defense system
MKDTRRSLKELAEESGGVLSTKQICGVGLSRPALAQLVKEETLVRVRHGYYRMGDELVDEYVQLQSRCSRSVYSYGTALFFWGLSDRVPHVLDMTVPQGTNVGKIRRDEPNVRFHYVPVDVWDLGRREVRSPQGGMVVLYDKERCLCDMIRARRRIDLQLYTQALKQYFAQGADTRKLLKYGKRLGVEDQIRTYMEVLT